MYVHTFAQIHEYMLKQTPDATHTCTHTHISLSITHIHTHTHFYTKMHTVSIIQTHSATGMHMHTVPKMHTIAYTDTRCIKHTLMCWQTLSLKHICTPCTMAHTYTQCHTPAHAGADAQHQIHLQTLTQMQSVPKYMHTRLHMP